jgi:hypothetical protein
MKDWTLVLRWALVALPTALLLLLHERGGATAAAPGAPPLRVPSCGSPLAAAAAAGARWRGAAPLARHAIVFAGRASDYDMARIDTVVDMFGGPSAVDLYGVLGHRVGEEAAAGAALAAFAAHPAAVAAELFPQPHPALTPEAAAAMPSWSYGTYDVPYFSPHDTAMIHTSLLRGWRLVECAQRAAAHAYGMVVRSRSDLRIQGSYAGARVRVDLDAYAAGRHGLEERLDGLQALEGQPHSDNVLHTSLPRGGAGDLRPHAPPGTPQLPLFLPARWNYGGYNVQLAWGPRATMQLYLTTLLHVEASCAGHNLTYAEETTLVGGLILRAAERGAVVAVHYVDVEYCLTSKLNPCPF